MGNSFLKSALLLLLSIPLLVFADADPCISALEPSPAALVATARNLRSSFRLFPKHRHLSFFVTPVQRLIALLEEHQTRLVGHPRASAMAAVVTAGLINEAQERLTKERVTYMWAHLFALRTLFVLDAPMDDGGVEVDLSPMTDASRFEKYFWNPTKAPPFLRDQLWRVSGLHRYLEHFPRVILVLAVDDFSGQGAFWDIDIFNAIEGSRIYPLAIPKGERDVDGVRRSMLASYIHDLGHLSLSETYMRLMGADLWDRIYGSGDSQHLKHWRRVVTRINDRMKLIEDPVQRSSLRLFFYCMYHEIYLYYRVLELMSEGENEQRIRAEIDRDLPRLIRRFQDPKDQNGELPLHLRSASADEILSYLEFGKEAFLAALDSPKM